MRAGLRFSCFLGLALIGALPGRAERSPAGVAILHAAAWAPADSVREGAGEFEVLLHLARLQRQHRAAGLVSVGDRHGARPAGGERALARATLSGIAIVKLAPGGEVADQPGAVFLQARGLGAEEAGRILAACLEIHGAPPRATNVEQPTSRDLAAIRSHLGPFQDALNEAATGRVALR